jgi:peroxiredoxin
VDGEIAIVESQASVDERVVEEMRLCTSRRRRCTPPAGAARAVWRKNERVMTRIAWTLFLVLVAACTPDAPKVIAEPAPKPAVGPGSKAPPFSRPSLTTSGAVKLVPGKVMLVVFWATWNGPCKESFPKLQALYTQYAARGFEMAALSVDDASTGVGEAATSWGAKFPVGWDSDHAIATDWRVPRMPTLYLIDRSGVVRHVYEAWHDGQEKDVEKELSALVLER